MGQVTPTCRLVLPYPPSINHYWRRVGLRTLLSREGREYRRRVVSIARLSGYEILRGSVALDIALFMPDRRRRDIDNVLKALLDAMEHARVYENDCQVDRLQVRREGVVKGGKVIVEISKEVKHKN